MSFETLKEQVDALTDAERRRLMKHLVAIEVSKAAPQTEPHQPDPTRHDHHRHSS